jgi:prefoldin subunit 5
MSCTTGQTSAILDCICVNGKPLIDYIDTGDQHLQQLITAIQATITSLQACCTSHSQAIATLQGLISIIQGEIVAFQTCCNTNTAAITTLQGIITTLQGQITNLQNAITAIQAQAHPRLTLTKNQDITNRATLDVINQVLNLPPAIAGRLNSLALTVPVGLNNPTVIPGLTPDYDTIGGAMATTSGLVIPRTGRYNISGSWGTNQPASCGAYVLGASVFINGAAAGRYTAPSNALADQVALTIPGHLLQAGDTLQLGGYTDCAGVIATSAYLAAEYIEGT